mmetsp:Transcript_116022/g.322571  ORF Transcript_116022/g.322571 Transcript_116022/m.322571 type:complete len:146 (+) Transcript_116022:123-560(+)
MAQAGAVARLLARQVGPRASTRSLALAPGATRAIRGAAPAGVNPPYHRLPMPTSALAEEHELVWHDGVAPEGALDFDAPHMSTAEGVAWWLGGFGFFFTLYQLVKATNPEGKRPSAKRELPPGIENALGHYKEERKEAGRVVIYR